MMDDNRDIKDLKGIGDKTASLYHKVGIYTYGDLMCYYPRDYMKYDPPVTLSNDRIGSFVFARVRLNSRPLMRKAGRMAVVSAQGTADGGEVRAVWFHMPYLTRSLRSGSEYIFAGELKKNGQYFSFEQPLIFSTEEYERLKDTLQPIYPLTKGLTNNAVKKAVKQVLSSYKNDDMISGIRLSDALNGIHFPKNTEELRISREALVYDEFLLFILRLRLLKEDNERAVNSFDIVRSDKVHNIMESLPYSLTKAQIKAFNDVEKDMTGRHSMSRLIQGDVGCGKTIVAILACLTAALCGYQCAVMVPTEILASQHYASFMSLIEQYNMDVQVCLLTGSMSAASKREALKKIENGEAGIVIGTHALFQSRVSYRNLALVVTDEQHRFGVRQRGFLVDKGEAGVPHVLVMSATPIPRTLAIMIYGDLDISVIDEVPARRLPVKNCVVGTSYRNKAYDFIQKEVSNGHQAYVICPLVEKNEELDLKDVETYTQELRSLLPSSISIACLHGQMKPAKKDEVMKDYLEGRVDVLVSTTVVEVGVNVPNATVMMIENAERFGLAQLHQLRGRIGRGDAQSYCIFINSSDSEKSMNRLSVLNRSNDGFYIASEDLKQRGPGDMFGIRQSGDMQFKLGDVFTDASVLERASKDASGILENDPDLSQKENAHIRERIDKLNEVADIHAL